MGGKGAASKRADLRMTEDRFKNATILSFSPKTKSLNISKTLNLFQAFAKTISQKDLSIKEAEDKLNQSEQQVAQLQQDQQQAASDLLEQQALNQTLQQNKVELRTAFDEQVAMQLDLQQQLEAIRLQVKTLEDEIAWQKKHCNKKETDSAWWQQDAKQTGKKLSALERELRDMQEVHKELQGAFEDKADQLEVLQQKHRDLVALCRTEADNKQLLETAHRKCLRLIRKMLGETDVDVFFPKRKAEEDEHMVYLGAKWRRVGQMAWEQVNFAPGDLPVKAAPKMVPPMKAAPVTKPSWLDVASQQGAVPKPAGSDAAVPKPAGSHVAAPGPKAAGPQAAKRARVPSEFRS